MTIGAYKPIQQVRDVQPIRATCFHPSGEVYVVGTNSKALKICKYPDSNQREKLISAVIQTNDEDENDVLHKSEVAFTFLHIHSGSVYCAAFNRTGDLLATGSNDQIVHVIKYNSDMHAPSGSEYKLSIHDGTVRDLCFMQGVSSSLLVSAGAGNFDINVTDCNTMKLTHALRGHTATIMSLHCCNESSTTFVSGGLDGTIRMWDLRCKQPISVMSTLHTPALGGDSGTPDETSPTRRFDQGPVERTESSHDESLSVDVQSNNGIKQQKQQEQENCNNETKGIPVGAVRVDKTGRLLVSGHQDGTCMLYDVRGRRIVQQFQAHEDEIRTLNFSPNSYYLLTGSYDHKVKLTDLQGQLTDRLPIVEVAELDDKVVQTAWHPVDYNFVTTCANGSATLWTIPSFDEWIDSVTMA